MRGGRSELGSIKHAANDGAGPQAHAYLMSRGAIAALGAAVCLTGIAVPWRKPAGR